ncbi:A24 family peptidase [Dongia deserti]|uniref:A24 family peptidase n=1 Tax=Dongia deserti TaxID=2268030 RepID=UPI000E659173|nr:prepilin peptidase [Dongia deserti]
MTYADWIHVLAASATAILLIAAGVSDVRRYRIPNTFVYAIVIAFAIGAIFNMTWSAMGWSVLAGLGMFLLGAGLFALGLFGGGDVKLIAAMALWTGLPALPRFLFVMTAAGGLLGVVWMLKRRRQRPVLASDPASPSDAPHAAALSSDNVSGQKVPNRIPYGVAIAIAGLDFFVTSMRSPFTPFWSWLQ